MIIPALSFGSAAHLYDSVRPTYPADAVAWALGGAGWSEAPGVIDDNSPSKRQLRVLDLGAGTGLLTGVLLAAGHDVVAVEPDEQMRAVAAERYSAASVLAGSAENIPLPDASIDAVVVGQAYHWFTPQRALPQIRRVLRDGGVFAPVWNVRDDRVPWVAALSGIVGSEGYGLKTTWPYGPVTPWFTEPEQGLYEHAVPMATARLVDLVRSRSFYLTADDATKMRLDAEIAELIATDPALAGRDTIDVPYRTCVYRMCPA
ncbi:MAG TPA: class I SAM-dependent methyltransferase [Micromonosporaceae bacterium]|jgi:SAM-dependent methyltransferase